MKSSNWIIILLILALIFFLWKWRACTSTPCPATDCVASCTAWCDSVCASKTPIPDGPCTLPSGYESFSTTDAATFISAYNANYKTYSGTNNGGLVEQALIDYFDCMAYASVSVELGTFPGSKVSPIYYAKKSDGTATAYKKIVGSGASETGPMCPTFCPKP